MIHIYLEIDSNSDSKIYLDHAISFWNVVSLLADMSLPLRNGEGETEE